MDFCSEYPRLDPAHQDSFRRVVTRLLSGRVLTPGPPLKPDADWRFTERHKELIDAYLRIGGWRLDLDQTLRLCRAVHEAREQRVHFSKLESLVLVTLRIVYHEQMRLATEDGRCELRIGELKERLVQFGREPNQLPRRGLADAVKRLHRHSLVEIERGFEGADDELIVVSPLIERVLPPDRIQDLHDRVRSYNSEPARADADPEDDRSGEEPAEEDAG